jgi:cell wall-associated NlpC family hydrolase
VASDWKEALAAAPNAEAEKIRMLEMMKPLPPAMQEAARRNPEGQRAGNPQQTVAQSNPTESATPKKEGASNKPSQRIKAGRMILDRSKANIVRVHGVVTRCDPARRWPGTYYAYTGTWVKTDDGETVIVLGSNKPEAQTVGAVLDTEVRDAGSKYEGHRVMNEAVPVP